MVKILLLTAFALTQTAFADGLVLPDGLLSPKKAEPVVDQGNVVVTKPKVAVKPSTDPTPDLPVELPASEPERKPIPVVKEMQTQPVKAKVADKSKVEAAAADENAKKKEEKPSYPKCTSNAKQADAMTQDKIGREVMGLVWQEQTPLVGGKGYMKLVNAGGQLQVYMYSAKGELKGKAPTTLCATKSGMTASLNRSALNFGFFVNTALDRHLAKYQDGDTSVMRLNISPAKNGQMYITDAAPKGSRQLEGPWKVVEANSVR